MESIRTCTNPALCNKCGKQLDELDLQENFGFDHHVGYGSRYDLMRVKARFCCDCFDEFMDRLVAECKISPIVGEYELCNEVPASEVLDEIAEEAS